MKDKTIVLNYDKVGENYAYQGSFKLRKNGIKWMVDPKAKAYLGQIGYWWFQWTKALKYKRVKE